MFNSFTEVGQKRRAHTDPRRRYCGADKKGIEWIIYFSHHQICHLVGCHLLVCLRPRSCGRGGV